MGAATFYNVRVENIKNIDIDKEHCECLTLGGRTDFSKVSFTMTTTEGRSVAISADRCGGNGAEAIVCKGGEEYFRSSLPDQAERDALRAKEEAHPNWMQ